MNSPLRKVSIAVLLMFGALLINANIVQVGEASSLKANPRNTRQLLERLSHERGPIVVGSKSVATSVPVNDQYKYLRTYPYGSLFANVTGYYTLYTATGIEKSQDNLLSGDDDRLFVRRLSDYLTGRQPKGGAVVLTLDAKAQLAAALALGNRRGAVVAMDPRTGAILAMVTSPTFDPTPLASHDLKVASAAYAKLAADPASPLLNRPTQETYPPGSLFKIVTAATALSSGKYTPSTVVPAPRQLKLPLSTSVLNNFGGESCGNGSTDTLIDAFTISCNTAFANIGLSVGANALAAQAAAFGLGRAVPGFPLPQADSVFPSGLDKPETALSAIGQFDVRITPMQAAMIVSAVANRGVEMRPYLIDQLRGPDLSLLSKTTPHVFSTPITPAVAAQLTEMMKSVVTRGTGTSAQIPGVAVAGKTGTAQHGTADHATGQPPDAWFGGFAPADNPRVAVAVIVEDGGDAGSEATGGTVAAPIARAVMQAVLDEHG